MNSNLSRLGILFCILLTAASCSSTKPPAPAATQGNKVIAALKDMSGMYEKKNLRGFMSLVSDDFKNRKEFASALESVFSKYEAVRFTVQYTRMLITIEGRDKTAAAFNWEGEWRTPEGTVLKNSGRANFFFSPDARLLSIEGKSPFVPQKAELPGKQ